MDDRGQVAEDLRTQVLGQLNSTLSYDKLYQDALNDPTLKRTREELEVAISNASLARKVVFELFQDLDRFNIGDYQKFDDEGKGMERLVSFVSKAVRHTGESFKKEDTSRWIYQHENGSSFNFTCDRERALLDEKLELLGLEHPIVRKHISAFASLNHGQRGIVGKMVGIPMPGLLTIWKINTQTKDGQSKHCVLSIGMTTDGERAPWIERAQGQILSLLPHDDKLDYWQEIARSKKEHLNSLLLRELQYKGIVTEEMTYSAELLGLVGMSN